MNFAITESYSAQTNMDLLAAERLHAEPLLHIKATSYRKGRQIGPEGGELVYAVYSSVICSLSGFSLFQTLRGCRGQVALRHAKGRQKIPDVSLDFKKYSMSALSSTYQAVSDASFIGCGSVNNFDHLLTATLSEGFYSNYRPSPPQHSLVATTGDWPWLKFQYTRDGAVAPLELTDVAVTVISKIPGWLGWGSNKAPEQKVRPAEKLDHRFSLTDKRRAGRSLTVSPDGSLFAVTDVLGRVALIDARMGVAIRMWKGYRDVDCAFIEVEEEQQKSRHRKHSSSSSSSSQQQQRRALFLVIYSPKKSMLEVFALRHGPLVAALRVGKRGKLIYTPHGLLGFSTPPQKGNNASNIPAAFLSEDGLMDIVVPFHCALTDSSSARAKDMHLVKQLRAWLKDEQYDGDKLIEEVTRVSTKLATEEGRLHLIDVLSSLKQITAPALIAAISQFSFEEPSASSSSKSLQHHCEQLRQVLDFYLFSKQLDGSKRNMKKDALPLNEILQMSERDCNFFLEFLKHTHQISGPRKDAKVGFSSPASSGLPAFLKNLDVGGAYPISFKASASDEGIRTVGEIIFTSLERNTDCIEEWRTSAVKSRIEPMAFARAFLAYKLQKQSSLTLEDAFRVHMVILKGLSMLPVPGEPTDFSAEATWWKELREILFNSRNVLIALPIAVCCRAVTIVMEKERLATASPSIEATEEAILQDWENISADVWEWDKLISQLEDTALLNAVLSIKHSAKLPPPSYGQFPFDAAVLSSQDLFKGGDGAVTELIAKWLCQFELPPEMLIFKSDVEFLPIHHEMSLPLKGRKPKKGEEPLVLPLIELSEEAEPPTDYNSKILGNLKILKSRFPYGLTSSALLSNITWELFSSWHKDLPNTEFLTAALRYLQSIPSAHLRGAIANLAWSTYMKVVFEGICRLVGKIGRLPTDQLCSRELNIPRSQVPIVLDSATRLLSIMLDAYAERPLQPFCQEAIRDASSLVAVAVGQPSINEDLVLLHHQASTCIHLVAALDIRHTRILAVLFDSLKSELFGALTIRRNVSLHHPGLNSARLQFLKRAVSASVQTIREVEGESGGTQFDMDIATARLRECFNLASAWRLPLDDLRRQHACELYSCGFDRLAEEVVPAVSETSLLASQLLVVVGQRVKALLADSPNYTELVSNLNPVLTAWMDSLDGEVLKETNWNVDDAKLLMTRVLQWLPNDHIDYNLATLLAECLPGLAQEA